MTPTGPTSGHQGREQSPGLPRRWWANHRLALSMGALLGCGLVNMSCDSLLDENADSYLSEEFIRGNWSLSSIRMVDGLTLEPGDNQSAEMPGVIRTVVGSARFSDGRADIQYSVTVTGPNDASDAAAYAFVGPFEIDKTTLTVTQDDSGEVVQLGVRRDFAVVVIGEREVDSFGMFDGGGNQVLWACQ